MDRAANVLKHEVMMIFSEILNWTHLSGKEGKYSDGALPPSRLRPIEMPPPAALLYLRV